MLLMTLVRAEAVIWRLARLLFPGGVPYDWSRAHDRGLPRERRGPFRAPAGWKPPAEYELPAEPVGEPVSEEIEEPIFAQVEVPEVPTPV